MAFRTARFAVSSTAVQIVDAVAGDVEACVEVSTDGSTDFVYLGGTSGVTTGNGFRLQNADNILNIGLSAGDKLWAISGASSPEFALAVHVLIRSASAR